MFFSVIIPAYNREKELPECINSVLNQTHKEFELIIVDNGSTDNTKEIVQNYINKDSRIKYFWQENSGSPAGSRNTGIKKAIYDWVAFLDSDDSWLPTKLEKVASVISQNSEIVAVSNFENFYEGGEYKHLIKNGSCLSSEPYFELLFKGNTLSTSAMTIKKNLILEVGLFNESKAYIANEDYDLWMKIAQKGKFYYIKEPLGIFNQHKLNMSNNSDMLIGNLKNVITDHIQRLTSIDKDKLLKIHLARADFHLARLLQKNGEFDRAKKILINSIRTYPFSWKKFACLSLCFLNLKR